MVVALNPLHKVNPIKRLVISSYQATSGTGVAAINELLEQSRQFLDGKKTTPVVYRHQIAFNVFPEIDDFWIMGIPRKSGR